MSEAPRVQEAIDRADDFLRRGCLRDDHIRAIAQRLAIAHEGADRGVATDDPVLRVGRLRMQIEAIERGLPELADDTLREVESAQQRFLEDHAERLRARERAGHVRASRAAPLRLADFSVGAAAGAQLQPAADARGPTPARDVCVDLAGLALELTSAQRSDLAERLLSAYAGWADDFELYGVVDFYQRDCALALAAAEAGRSSDAGTGRATTPAEIRRLLLVALAAGRRPLLPPVLVAVGGLVASGKTTVSRALAERLGAPRIEADRVRDVLLGDRPGRSVHESEWARSFSPGFEKKVYAELLRRADVVLGSGRAAVLDACFARACQRVATRALAGSHRRPFLFVECRVEEALARARLAARSRAVGDVGWLRISESLARRWEASAELAAEQFVALDSGRALGACLATLESRLPTWPEELRG
jgi:predicted kinase